MKASEANGKMDVIQKKKRSRRKSKEEVGEMTKERKRGRERENQGLDRLQLVRDQ